MRRLIGVVWESYFWLSVCRKNSFIGAFLQCFYGFYIHCILRAVIWISEFWRLRSSGMNGTKWLQISHSYQCQKCLVLLWPAQLTVQHGSTYWVMYFCSKRGDTYWTAEISCSYLGFNWKLFYNIVASGKSLRISFLFVAGSYFFMYSFG